MPSPSIRKLDEEAAARRRARAANRGVSMEEEVRSILRRSVSAPKRLTDPATEIFGPNHGIDLDPALPTRVPHPPPDLLD